MTTGGRFDNNFGVSAANCLAVDWSHLLRLMFCCLFGCHGATNDNVVDLSSGVLTSKDRTLKHETFIIVSKYNSTTKARGLFCAMFTSEDAVFVDPPWLLQQQQQQKPIARETNACNESMRKKQPFMMVSALGWHLPDFRRPEP